MAEKIEKTENQEIPPEKELTERPETEIEVSAQAKEENDPLADVERLKKQIEVEKQGRLAAERRAQEQANMAHQAGMESLNAKSSSVDASLEHLKSNMAVLKRAYAEYMAAGDFAQVADIQEGIANNAQLIREAEQEKQKIEQFKKNPPRPQVQQSSDPIEAAASQLTPRSADWIRAHPQYVTRNGTVTPEIIAAHNLAVARGHVADSDSYFEAVEKILDPDAGRRRPAQSFEDDEVYTDTAKVMAPRRNAAPAAAPVSREPVSNGGTPTNTRAIRLSPEEQEVAKLSGLTNEQYAAQKLKIAREAKQRLN